MDLLIRVCDELEKETQERIEMVEKLTCSHCGEIFGNDSDLNTHMEMKHTASHDNQIKKPNNVTRFPLTIEYKPQCAVPSGEDKMPPKLPNVTDHTSNTSCSKIVTVIDTPIEKIQMGEKLYRCSECDLTNDHTGGLYTHMKKAHKGFMIKKKGPYRPSIEKKQLKNNVMDIVMDRCDKMLINDFDFDRICGSTQLEPTLHDMQQNFDLPAVDSEVYSTEETIESINDFTDISNPKMAVDNKNSVNENKIVKIIKTPKKLRIGGAPMYKCSECDHSGNQTSNLYKHMRFKHKGFVIEKMLNKYVPDPRFSRLTGSDNDGIVTVIKTPKELIQKGEKRYRCSECGRPDNQTSKLYLHMSKCHEGLVIKKLVDYRKTNVLLTPKKEEPTNSSDSNKVITVIKSSMEEMNKGIKRYRCSECAKDSSNACDLYMHMELLHKDCVIQPLSGPTEENAMEIGDMDKTIRAIDVNTKIGRRYKCSKCYFIAQCIGDVYSHMRKRHKDFVIIKRKRRSNITSTDKFVNKIYGRDSLLSDPAITKRVGVIDIPCANIGGNRYKCSLCDLVSKTTTRLYKHMRIHHKGFAIIKRAGRDEINRHGEDNLTDDDSICEVHGDERKLTESDGVDGNRACEDYVGDVKGFDTKQVKTVTLIELPEGNYRYKCSECNVTCNYRGMLYKHMRNRHKGFKIIKMKKPFHADTNEELNSKIRSSRTVYVMDILKIGKRRRYKCSACDKTGFSTTNLYRHMRTAHKGFAIIKRGGRNEMNHASSQNDDSNLSNNSNENVINSITKETDNQYESFQYDHSVNDELDLLSENVYESAEDDVAENDDRISLSSDFITDLEITKFVRILDISENGIEHYKCSECDKTSSHTSSLYSHMRITHKGFAIIKKHGFNEINVGLSSEEDVSDDENSKTVQDLDILIKGRHQYKCSKCDYTALDTSVLFEHMKTRHTDLEIGSKRNFNDTTINNTPTFADDVSEGKNCKIVRVIDMIGNPRYKCSECDQKGSSTGMLYKHMRRKHKDLKIVFKNNHIKHKKKYLDIHDDSDKDSFENSDGEIVEEMLCSASEIDQYECSICTETFSSRSNLDHHVKIHRGEKSIKCSLFDYASKLENKRITEKNKCVTEKGSSGKEIFSQKVDKLLLNNTAITVLKTPQNQKSNKNPEEIDNDL